jgi:tRNA A37 threonylcarbamoyladenosine modification protein TsaB
LTPAIHPIFVTLHALLAIDTALAACAAAVLDTDHGVVASETLWSAAMPNR